ncbi:hypothetical protein VitviT2T_013700 [Vitis vinifera]|uniref:DDE Tnp4 domain-containing protein n=1 Tax=Vitis vinifera TaxID=29760 RepID=A0ABY9CIG7_VITVI|nr:hypothetical protein VitviT2T_013700 [Vitis vinifera]
MSPTYRGSGLSFGSIGSLDDIIESFRLHAAGGGKDLYGTTKHKRVQPLLRREEDPACGPLIDFIAFRALYPPRPSSSKYLVDAGYPQMSGYLGPYKGERYHLPDFRRGSSPRGKKEIFNHRHSSLRCTIERTFVVLKNRWRML